MAHLAEPMLATDRQPRCWIRRVELILLLLVTFGWPIAAWVDYLAFGLPRTLGNEDPANPLGTHQFPLWIRIWHYLNLMLVVLLAGTGWQILAGRPWLAWSESGSPWCRFHFHPGAAEGSTATTRVHFWHALLAVGWAVTGFIYVALVASTGEQEHLVPLTWKVFPEAWHVFVQYATFHLQLDPDGFYRYNSLQLLSYTTVMFGFVPVIILTGLAISPAFSGRFRNRARLFGNREAARSIHYLAILGYVTFIGIHVSFVVIYAIWLNGNHVVLGTDETGLPGWLIGGAGTSGIALIAYAIRRIARGRSD